MDIKGRRSLHDYRSSTMTSPPINQLPRLRSAVASSTPKSKEDNSATDEEISSSETEESLGSFQTTLENTRTSTFFDDSYRSSKSSPDIQSSRYEETQDRSSSVLRKSNHVDSGYSLKVIIISIGLAAFTGLVIYDYYQFNPKVNTNVEDLGEIVTKRLMKLMKGYPNQKLNTWFAFGSGIEDVMIKNRTSTFLLLYTGSSKKIMRDIVKTVAQVAAEVLQDVEYVKAPIELQSLELNKNERYLKDNGKFITDYRKKLEQTGVMVIHNLGLLNSEIAKTLHGICDEITPIVAKSVIILTAEVKDLNAGKEVILAEKLLKESWKDIDNDILWALVSRLTGSVLKIYPEPQLSDTY